MKFERTLLLFAGFLFISFTTCEGLSFTKNYLRNSALISASEKKTLIEPMAETKYPEDTHSDVAVTPDGTVWTTGTAAIGYKIRKWDEANQKWLATGGGGKRISIGADGMPWIIAGDGTVYAYTNSGWVYKNGYATDIARCPKHDYTWVVGGDGLVWKWDSGVWSPNSGYGKKVTCDLQGNPWVVGLDNNVWQYQNNSWKNRNVFAVDISIARDGSVFIVGGTHGTGGYDVLVLDNATNKFVPVGVKAMSLTAVAASKIYDVNENNSVFYQFLMY